MEAKDSGGPAYPSPNDVQVGQFQSAGHPGMTLRDWFAGQALTAVSIQAFDDELTVEQNARVAAVWAYTVADAMLEARK